MAGSANAAMEKLNDPGVENSLFSDDIKKGGAVCECMLLSISSSLFELKQNKNVTSTFLDFFHIEWFFIKIVFFK